MDSDKKYALVNLPYSEVCVHMQVAGRLALVEDVGHGMAQIYLRHEDDDPTRYANRLWKRHSFPVLHGEAGITNGLQWLRDVKRGPETQHTDEMDVQMRDLEGHGNLEGR